MRVGLAGLVAAVLLAGCTQQSEPGSASTTPVPSARRTIVEGRLNPCPMSTAAAQLPTGGLPDLTLSCLDPGSGVQQVRLAGLRGTPLVLTVWASWCAPCRTELPAVAEVAKAAAGTVTFLGIDVEDQSDDARALAAELKVEFNSVVDPDGLTKTGLGWLGPPITLFVAADGHVVNRTIGPVGTASQLRGLIATNLGVRVP